MSLTVDNEGMNGLDLAHQDRKDHTLDKSLSKLSLSSRATHADDFLNDGQDVAPPMHVSTTFRYSNNPEKLAPLTDVLECKKYHV